MPRASILISGAAAGALILLAYARYKRRRQWVVHYREHGFAIVRNVLMDADFTPLVDDLEAAVAKQASEWLARGLVASTHAEANFEKRLALLDAELPKTSEMEAEMSQFCLSLDTMHARMHGCFRFLFNDRLLDAIEQVVGGEICLSPIQHLRPFLPTRGAKQRTVGAASVTPWHQDMGVTREEADASTIVTCWVPLVDVRAETGALVVLPDQHSCQGRGLLAHVKNAEGATTIDPRLLPDALLRKAVSCEMRRGDILVMHHFTPHRSQPNRSSDRVRWSVDLRFQEVGSPTGRHFWPELTVRSRHAPAQEQRSYQQWCERWVHALANSEGQRWHRVAGDVGGRASVAPTP